MLCAVGGRSGIPCAEARACPRSSALQAIPTAAEFLTFSWDGSEGSFATQAEAKAAFLEALKKVSGACWGCRSPCPAEG